MKISEQLEFNLATKLIIGLFLLFFFWWIYIQILETKDSPVNLWFAAGYSLIPLYGGINGILISRHWKKDNNFLSRAVLFFSIGLVSWGIGEVVWSCYNLFLDVEVPYPSVADAAFFLSLPMWSIGILYLARGLGIKVALENPFVKLILIGIPLALTVVCYYLLFVVARGATIDLSGDYLKLFFDIGYPVLDALLLIFVFVINALAFGYIRDKYLLPFALINAGLVFNFFADLGFTYQTNFGTFYNGSFVDLLYMLNVSFMSLGTNLLPSGDLGSPNLQSILLKQRDEEIKEVNLKLRERDQMLSRINQEIYKKNLELIEEKRKAEALLYNVSESVLVLDKEFKIVLFNKSAQVLFGLNEDQAVGKGLDEVVNLYTSRNIRMTAEVISSNLTDTTGTRLPDLTLRREDGRERFVNLAASKVSAENDSLYVIIISDVTEEKKIAKGREEFISIASHELRTPMTIVKNYLWMLQNKKGGELTSKQSEYLVKAINGTERMLKLIHDMLDISRMEQGKLELHPVQVNLEQLLSDITSDFKIRADQKGLNLNLQVQPSLPLIRADEDKLREVIVNLVGNSLKFTDTGSVVINANLEQDKKFVKVTVVDTGKGIDKDDLPKLFNKFGRLDNSFATVAESGGTGLGLYIVKSIIEAMGGKVGAYSDGIGKGSTFWFTLRSV